MNRALAIVALVGFIIQTVGGFIVVKGSNLGLCLTIIGSIFIGYALGAYLTARTVRETLDRR
jgi:hypothetical protein